MARRRGGGGGSSLQVTVRGFTDQAQKPAALPADHSPEFRPRVGMTLRTGIAALYTAATS
ncbi:hypothetical protein ACFRAR_15255 [Kitasatospora sp. NPDC056651]|uniref:hypothetical protein n=1 Tax=Kitasatospora sp. NPDC056651 TaxID=3345892 RepID=UPI0036BB2558